MKLQSKSIHIAVIQVKFSESDLMLHTQRDFYLKEEGGEINGNLLSTTYRTLSIPSGRLEISLFCDFKVRGM